MPLASWTPDWAERLVGVTISCSDLSRCKSCQGDSMPWGGPTSSLTGCVTSVLWPAWALSMIVTPTWRPVEEHKGRCKKRHTPCSQCPVNDDDCSSPFVFEITQPLKCRVYFTYVMYRVIFCESVCREGRCTCHFFGQNNIKKFRNVFSSSEGPDSYIVKILLVSNLKTNFNKATL